jgi:serine/threonine protein kinase
MFDETNWSGRGQHVEFGRFEGAGINARLLTRGVLGHSKTAYVERVLCGRIMLARKTIPCFNPIKREEMVEEVAHLQRLNHAHVVRGVGTYVYKKQLCILLYPAAQHNLATFLDRYVDLACEGHMHSALSQRLLPGMRAGLGKFIKCLVNTITFVHSNLVKHMDIKPANLLVQERVHVNETDYKIYLADFGIARSYRTAADVETDSSTSFTKAYAAPEVLRQDMRGFPADIFSLGLVFLETDAVLTNRHDELLAIRRRNLESESYANLCLLFSNGIPEGNANGLHMTISEYWDILRQMLSPDPTLRPTALSLQQTFDTTAMPCCSTGPEPFEAATPQEMDSLPE